MLFAALLAWSWRKWMDVHIDFGNELYVAWRLSEGDALYRDIASRNGPLSPYWNSLLFRWFGVSIRTLVIANLAVLAAICAMTWRVFARACDRLTALAAGTVLLCVFAFGQTGDIANFNYVTPYQHFQTHGLALSLAMLLTLLAAARGRGWGRGRAAWGVAGACLGCVFLTKVELFVPALVMLGAAFLARRAPALRRPAGAFGDGLACLLGALVPVAVFAGVLAAQMPLREALTGLVGNWAHLSGTLADPYYRHGAGLDDVAGNLERAALVVLAIAGFAGLATAVDRAGRSLSGARAVAPGLALGIGALLVVWGLRLPWPDLARALPFTSLAAAVWWGWSLRRDAAPAERVLPLFLWSVYATALLAKLGLSARFQQYGFVLAMPATLLLVAAGVHTLPATLRAHGGTGRLARALALGVAIGFSGFFLAVSQHYYASKRLEIGSGADAILAEVPAASPRPEILVQTLEALRARAAPGDTLLVLPEGLSLNYWLRMRNPTRFGLFLPTEIAAFGEMAMLSDLQAHPPDFVVLAHRWSHEFGVGPFGRDPRNGRALLRWVESHYRRVAAFGAEPFSGRGFGTVVLARTLRYRAQ